MVDGVLEVSKTTLRVSDSLGLTELRKAVILTVTVYHSENVQIKIMKGKGHRDSLVSS